MKKIIYPITTLVIVFAGPVLLQSFSNKNNMPVGEIYVVTTLAGYSDKGLQVDGKGDKAGFSSSVGNLFATADGNVFVMDQGTLRKIDPDGKVTSLLGLIAFDAEGNQLKLEALKGPDGICLDKAGNMYVSDGNGNMIYKIKPDMATEKLAGDNGYKGSDDGAALESGFNNPQGLCIDKAGNIYVADTYNYCVRKISADGKKVSTLAGSQGDFKPGTGKAAKLQEFRTVAVDSKGNVYVEQNARGSCVAKISPAGVVTSFVGDIEALTPDGNNDATGKAARFFRINALAVDANDNLIIGENYRVRKATPAGVVTTLAGVNEPQWRDAVGDKARFGMITGLSTDAKGNIYVSDSYCVRKISKQ